jgi:3-methyladenine DNA glycosylase AlkD
MTAEGTASLAAEIAARITAAPLQTVPALRALRRGYSRVLRGEPAQPVIRLATALCAEGGSGHRLFAYELVAGHPTAPLRLGPREIAALGRGIACWGAVDGFAVCVAGPAWRRGRIPDSLVHRWARSPDRWWRRAALVSTVPLNSRARGGAGDRRRTLAVCRLLEGDRDPMVVKALSWSLRELAKRDPAGVRRHLSDRGPALHARVRREVRSKLETGLKNPPRRRPAARGGP